MNEIDKTFIRILGGIWIVNSLVITSLLVTAIVFLGRHM
jgi:hypothetical protein